MAARGRGADRRRRRASSEVIRSVKKSRPHDIDPSTLTFQALRIATNEELIGLDRFVDDAVSVLETGARLAVISFHSLEDRIVKRAFRRLEGECTCPPNMPVCGCGAKTLVRILTGRPVTASEEEVATESAVAQREVAGGGRGCERATVGRSPSSKGEGWGRVGCVCGGGAREGWSVGRGCVWMARRTVLEGRSSPLFVGCA